MELHKKRKIQNVNFNTVDDFLDFLPEEELVIVKELRNIILDCIPGCDEHLAYNVPYYRKNKNICFIWPASVKWGNSKQKGVRLGFTKGYLIADDLQFLEKGTRKFVYWHDFLHVEEIDSTIIKAYVEIATELDAPKT